MKLYETIYDISVTLGSETIPYPGTTHFQRKLLGKVEDGNVHGEVSDLVMSSHIGTHLDAPAHFISSTKHIDDYSVEDFILPAQVVNIEDKEVIRPHELEKLDIKPGDALLFKTNNTVMNVYGKGVFSEKYVYLSPEAARLCVDKGVSLIGIDYLSVDPSDCDAQTTHRELLPQGVLILETIDLREVPPGRYTLICLPLKIRSGEGAPCRAVLTR